MPPANHVVLASGAAVAVSVAVAAAIALYESPELRRYADDVRRRIAIALYSIGDGITPTEHNPFFNRPEDAHGFFESRHGEGAEPGVDADEETRRIQREELVYWNSIRLQKEQEKAASGFDEKAKDKVEGETTEMSEKRPHLASRGSSFDDFLKQDKSAESGALVYDAGLSSLDQSGLRRRGDGARGVGASILSNPFADENFIDTSDMAVADSHADLERIAPSRDETNSDLYSATTLEPRTPTNIEATEPSLMGVEDDLPARSTSSATADNELQPDEFVTAGQEDRAEAYASIQAWAENSGASFYSPLPSTPTVPQSEPELLSDGQLTPTDSESLAGSGIDVANDAMSFRDGMNAQASDVISESDGMMTPSSWSDVGSVVSENDVPPRVPAQ